MPCVARPAAMVTACCSQMPTSMSRCGNSLNSGSRPVPPGIAAVIATVRSSLFRISRTVSAKTDVYCGAVAVSLLCVHVHEHRSVAEVARLREDALDGEQIVAVHRTEIREAELFEQEVRDKQRLEAVEDAA